jgi:hypothetical protein
VGAAVPLAGRLRPGLAVVCGAAVALSVADFGFYDLSLWGPACLVALAAAFAAAMSGAPAIRGAALVAVGGLVALWALALASRGWSEAPDQALVVADRWLLYAAVLALLVWLCDTRRTAALLLAGAGGAVAAVALYIAVRMAVGDGKSLFVSGRLNDPLGYINGQGAFLMLGFWPLVAVAERARAVPAGAAAAGATLVASLAVLSQARGVALAALVTVPLALLLVPGRHRRAWVLLAIGLAVAAIHGPLLDVYRQGRVAQAGDIERAGQAALVIALFAGVAVGLACQLATSFVDGGDDRREALRGLSGTGLAIVAAGLLLLAAVFGGRLADRVRDQARGFTSLHATSSGGSRFLSGSGQRYDYWRIAWHEFKREPVRGRGAGSYPVAYFAERRSTEDIRQPHSLELQVLSELGLAGGLALLLFAGGVLAAVGLTLRRARGDPAAAGLAVAAGGTFLVWLVHTSVDWLHLIPGLTGLALCAAAAVLGPLSAGRPPRTVPRWARPAALAALAVVLAVGAVGVIRPVLALHARTQARADLRTDPRGALEHAQDAVSLEPEAIPSYRLEAAAQARLGRYGAARGALLEAIGRQPRDFVSWALLGDLAVRRGDLARARRYYGRAHGLNPRDVTLERLARNPGLP